MIKFNMYLGNKELNFEKYTHNVANIYGRFNDKYYFHKTVKPLYFIKIIRYNFIKYSQIIKIMNLIYHS